MNNQDNIKKILSVNLLDENTGKLKTDVTMGDIVQRIGLIEDFVDGPSRYTIRGKDEYILKDGLDDSDAIDILKRMESPGWVYYYYKGKSATGEEVSGSMMVYDIEPITPISLQEMCETIAYKKRLQKVDIKLWWRCESSTYVSVLDYIKLWED